MRLGLVFEGGGAKGAYHIGVWKAIRELGIEKHITSVSGTSVGALNAAMFYLGKFEQAEHIWENITNEDILNVKSEDYLANGNCIFSQQKLSAIVEQAISGEKHNKKCDKCYITCRSQDKAEHRYFEWSRYIDNEYKKKILLASSAIPGIFASVEIDGEFYVDGGANADNTPVMPLTKDHLDRIIIIHLSNAKANNDPMFIDIIPSQDIGAFIDGTLDFEHSSIMRRIELGYADGMRILLPLAELLCIPEIKTKKSCKRKTHDHDTNKTIITEENEMNGFTFTNDEARKDYETRIAALRSNLEAQKIDTAYLWNETAHKYAKNMLKVKSLLETDEMKQQITSKMYKDIDTFLSKCKDNEFHIALVGAIKAGKSMLINAMLGYEYSSTKVTPETASLTKFKKSSKNYVKAIFYSVNEWNELWESVNKSNAAVFLEEYKTLNAESIKNQWLGHHDEVTECETREELKDKIYEWTSSKSSLHYFVKEVEVGLKEFELPDGVVLVDTPGLNDVVEYRSNITRDYIARANAVLVCVKSDALNGQELQTIINVFSNTRYNPEKVYVIATQTDTLNHPVEDWKNQRDEWLKYLKQKSTFASAELAKKNLIAVSGYLYLLLKEYKDLPEDSDEYWALESIAIKYRIRMKEMDERYNELLDYTNIEMLKRTIKNEIVSKYEELLIEDIKGTYDICKESITFAMNNIKKNQQEIIDTAQGGIEEIKKKKEEYEKKYKEAEEDKKELDHLIELLRKQTSDRAAELAEQIRDLA